MNLHNEMARSPRMWTLRSPLFAPLRLVLALTAVLFGLQGAGLVDEWLRGSVLGLPPGPTGFLDPLLALISVAGAGSAYVAYVRLLERRPARELGLAGAASELGLGALLGTGLIALCVGVLWALGAYHVTGMSISAAILSALGAAIFAGFVEELLMRGIVFRQVEEVLGTWSAVLVSAILFGATHARNPGANAWSAVAIALEAGVLLGAAFVLTRRLWLAVGLHFAWNFVQGGVFGLQVSGIPGVGLFTGELVGPPLLTGGSFGMEASPVAVLTCLMVAVLLLVRAQQQGRIVRSPYRARSRTPA